VGNGKRKKHQPTLNSSELYSTEPSSTLLAKSAWYSLLAMAPLNEFKERKKRKEEEKRRRILGN